MAGKVSARRDGTCPKGSKHHKGRRGCFRVKKKKR